MKFIEPWLEKAKNDDVMCDKKFYAELKNSIKKSDKGSLKGLTKVLIKFEETLDIAGLIKLIDDYVQKVEDEDVEEKITQMKILDREMKLREKAEEKLYGKVSSKRVPIKDGVKEAIFRKFDNQCAICNKTEGLHIHHKDKNPKERYL